MIRRSILIATVLVALLLAVSQAFAQSAPQPPGSISPAVAAAVSRYAHDAGYPYVGDCQESAGAAAAVCSLVFAQPDGSYAVEFHAIGDDGAYTPDAFDATTLAGVAGLPTIAPPVRLIIPSIGVDARVVSLGLIPGTTTLDSPTNKDDVGYYNFTPVPDYGGNTVLSGHVDWYTQEAGVFWGLKQLGPGDQVQVGMPDGSVFSYSVTTNTLYDNDSVPTDDVLGDTPRESVTLITCEGVFNQALAEYDKRRVVRAERVYE